MKTIRYRSNGKSWILPNVINLGDNLYKFAKVFYDVIGYRPVEKGEWYLSGAYLSAYKYNGINPTNSSYLVIKPTHFARQATACYERGEKIV